MSRSMIEVVLVVVLAACGQRSSPTMSDGETGDGRLADTAVDARR